MDNDVQLEVEVQLTGTGRGLFLGALEQVVG